LPVMVCQSVFEGDNGHNRGHNFPCLFRLPACPMIPPAYIFQDSGNIWSFRTILIYLATNKFVKIPVRPQNSSVIQDAPIFQIVLRVKTTKASALPIFY